MTSKAGVGSVVSLYYKGGILGEDIVDDRSTGEPLQVMLGDMQLPSGIEKAVMDMGVGEERRIVISPEDGYGDYQEALSQWYPRSMLDDGYSIMDGDVMFHRNPTDGSRQPAFVTSTTEDAVKIDFNHPFAGKTLQYWIRLVSVD